MSRRRLSLQAAYVLNARAYRDTSLLLECFTRDQGRVGLVARGARGPKSRGRALLQPFQPLLLSWAEAGDLGTMTGAESSSPAHALNGESIFCGWYLNELLLRLLQRHDPHPELFEAYAETLRSLGGPVEPPLRRFEKRLLAELGYGLHLNDELRAGQGYRFDPQAGLSTSNDADAIPGAHLIALRDDALAGADELRTARRVLRAALGQHLGGRELESAKRLREMRGALSATVTSPDISLTRVWLSGD